MYRGNRDLSAGKTLSKQTKKLNHFENAEFVYSSVCQTLCLMIKTTEIFKKQNGKFMYLLLNFAVNLIFQNIKSI